MENLARNRFELFKEILKYRWLDLVLCSLCLGLFLIPNYLFNIFVQDTFLSESNIYNYVFVYFVKIIFFMIFGLGVSGAMYFFKRLTFGEGASVRRDFFYGIRQNYKPFLAIYFFLGLFYALLKINFALMVNTYTEGSDFPIVLMGIYYVIYAIIVIISLFMQTQAILYKATFKQLFVNAVKFLIGKFLKNILIFIVAFLPFMIIEFVQNDIVLTITIIAMIFGYLSFSLLLINLYTNSIYDETINKMYKELIRRGLQKWLKDIIQLKEII